MQDLTNTIGLQVEEIREFLDATYILFTDKKTILSFTEQDEYDYHDYDSRAKIIDIFQREAEWEEIHKKGILL